MNEQNARKMGGKGDWKRSILDRFSRPGVRRTGYALIVIFFIGLVLLPTLFVLTKLFTGWSDIESGVLGNSERMGIIWSAIGLSFGVALVVTFLDFVFGLPIAWFIVRRKFRGKSVLNTIIDAPLAIPTAGLGVSVALFWAAMPALAGRPLGAWSLFSVDSPFLLLVLLHFTTTFPYMIRSLAAILDEIDTEYEMAGRTCGASKLTAARTITLPMFRSGVATGAILCIAKALSETGGVMAALGLLAGTSFGEGSGLNGTALIGFWKDCQKPMPLPTCGGPDPTLLPALTFVSVLMILFSLLLLAIVKILSMKFRIPLRKVWPRFESRLSRGAAPRLRDTVAFSFLIFIVLIPSFFIMAFMATSAPSATVDWGAFWNGMFLTLTIASIATAIDLLLGVPLAILIVRGKYKKLGSVLDVLVNVPYIVPSAALGLSLQFFYRDLGIQGLDILLVTMAHVAFTFPFVVRNVVGGLEGLDAGYEDTARTLGARPFQTFKRIVFPIIKPSILAGAIMAFTRSVGETGATISVSSQVQTAPILIVNYALSGTRDLYTAGLLIAILTLICAMAILLMRWLIQRRHHNA